MTGADLRIIVEVSTILLALLLRADNKVGRRNVKLLLLANKDVSSPHRETSANEPSS